MVRTTLAADGLIRNDCQLSSGLRGVRWWREPHHGVLFTNLLLRTALAPAFACLWERNLKPPGLWLSSRHAAPSGPISTLTGEWGKNNWRALAWLWAECPHQNNTEDLLGMWVCGWVFGPFYFFTWGVPTTGINPLPHWEGLSRQDLYFSYSGDTVAASGWTDYFGDLSCFLDTPSHTWWNEDEWFWWIYFLWETARKKVLSLCWLLILPLLWPETRTSGLMKKTYYFEEKPCYLENFIQSIFFSIDL